MVILISYRYEVAGRRITRTRKIYTANEKFKFLRVNAYAKVLLTL